MTLFGTNPNQINIGSSKIWRVAKYNQLLRIEEELGKKARMNKIHYCFKSKKLFLLISVFLILYFFINLLSGERGLISYFEKKRILNELKTKKNINKSNK